MIDENNGYVTKSKLAITVKTLSKYNETNKQSNRLRDTETDKHLGIKHAKGRKTHTYK